MFLNYLKIAYRNLLKNKLFSFINIMGLGLALPFALMALMHLQSTFENDNFHPDSDRIYRIITNEINQEGNTIKYATSPFLVSDVLKKDYPFIDKATKTRRDYGWELTNKIKNLKVNTLYIEPSFFEVFGFKIDHGIIPQEANTLVLSHEAAQKFFGDTDPIGQILEHPTYGPFTVTGVLKPYKQGTQFRSDVMVSMATYEKFHPQSTIPESITELETYTFVKLLPTSDIKALQSGLKQIAIQSNALLASVKKSHLYRSQSLEEISPSKEQLRSNSYVESMEDIYFNFSIPLMILVLAGFNYTNLTLARSLSRSREVGVRKVIGAMRSQVFLQFIIEAILISVIGLAVGYGILHILRSNIHVSWVVWEVDNKYIISLLFIAFTLIMGLLAGGLPAWILSGFQPVTVLKGSITPATFGKIGFRKALIVIQFVASLGFVFMIGHMYNQFKYMATENDNFNRKDIVHISLPDTNHTILINEVIKNKSIEKIGMISVPFGGITAETAIRSNTIDEGVSSFYYAADANFIDNMNLKIIAGKNLPSSDQSNANQFVLINETALEKLRLGSPQEAIGKAIYMNNTIEPLQVAGVLKDFCHFNYQFEKQPVIFQYNPTGFNLMCIKTHADITRPDFIAEMKNIWHTRDPYKEMAFSWLDQELYERYYPSEDMKMMGMAAIVIFVIAIMGLLGIVIYSTEKRFKEISIRKVMGAEVWQIVKILSWSFVKLLLIAALIATPIGIIEGNLLGSVFIYYAGVNISLMFLFFMVIIMIALTTVVFFAMKAAISNPVKAIRTE